MWVITEDGMFSAVAHADDDDLIVVRTRVKADVEGLHAWLRTLGAPSEVITYASSDYPWRTITTRWGWAEYVRNAAEAIDYGNFKDRVKEVQGPERSSLYSRVWAVLYELEASDPDRQDPDVRWPAVLDDDADWATL